MAVVVGWQYLGDLSFPKIGLQDALKMKQSIEDLSNDLLDTEERIKRSVKTLYEKRLELQELEEKVHAKIDIRERELKTQVKTIETKLQKLRGEVNFGLTKVQRDVTRALDAEVKNIKKSLNFIPTGNYFK